MADCNWWRNDSRQTNNLNIPKLPKGDSKDSSSHIFLQVHICLDIKFDLISKARLDTKGDPKGASDEYPYCK